MSIILPYNLDLARGEGAFITPEGEILLTHGRHEQFAIDYCNGIDCGDLLRQLFYDESVDVYQTSKLSKEQLVLYKKWKSSIGFTRKRPYSDFLGLVLGFDKVETIVDRCITTVNSNPYTRFYNYYLMGWDTKTLLPYKYNDQTDKFEMDRSLGSLFISIKDEEVMDEADEIRNKVLLKDRHLFFK